MTVHVLEEQTKPERGPFQLLLAVSGFGSHSILSLEDGLHVLESPAQQGRGFTRCRARVRVAPQRGDPGNGRVPALRRIAKEAFADPVEGDPRIVRRYRREPSPLVRDGVRGWRTGSIDRVLAREFDVMQEAAAGEGD